MTRLISCLWLAMTLASACTSDPQTSAKPPASTPSPTQAATAGDPLPSWNEGPTAPIVEQWMTTAKHPQTGRLYTDMVYQPMVELLTFLRANGFKTFIASGGGVEFMRGWTERVYGIPPEQVIGTVGKLKFEMREGTPVLIKLPEIEFVDDKEGKPAAIQSRIGRRPIAAFGNSDGDLQMLQWTMAGSGARLAVFVHHDDAAREFAYDRTDKLQHFDKGWDEAVAKGWTVVSMKNDWKTVFPPEK